MTQSYSDSLNETLPNQNISVKSPTQKKSDIDITIERCPHDEENPFTMIRNDLIRDNSISPNCRWLLIFLLSNKDKWVVKSSYLIKYISPYIGRDSFYNIMNEAIKAGYIKKQFYTRVNEEGGKLAEGFKYVISETPKFKEENRLIEEKKKAKKMKKLLAKKAESTGFPENQESWSPGILVGRTLNNNKEQEEEYIATEEYNPSLSPLPPDEEQPPPASGAVAPAADAAEEKRVSSSKPKKIEPQFSPQVKELYVRMIEALTRNNPEYRAPSNPVSFLKQVSYLLEKDDRNADSIMSILEYALQDNEERGDFKGWCCVIYSRNPAETLRKHFAKIYAQSRAAPKKKERKFAPCSDYEEALAQCKAQTARAI